MSSKIVSGKAATQAISLRWRPLNVPGSQASRGSAPEPSEQLLGRIRELEHAAETRAQESYRRGFEEGERKASTMLEPAIERFAAAAHELMGIRGRVRREAEGDIVMLAVAIARKLLMREIAVDSESLLGLVKAAMQKVDAREIHLIRVNPDDASALERALNGPGSHKHVKISLDPSLERGAVILETSRGNLDASVETQLKEIERGFLDLVRTKR